jgi:hypothetical protein
MFHLEFLMKVSLVRSGLAKLLGTDLSAAAPTPLHNLLNSLIYRWCTDDKKLTVLDIVRMEYLLKHLSEIEQYDSSMLRQFQIEFKRAMTQDNLEGLRFECYTAASLARRKLRFHKSEAPDFVLTDKNAAIECTSVRLTKRQPFKDLSYKIEAAISSKEKTKSNRPDVLLLIDITNILHDSDFSSVQELRPAAQERISRTSFAGVVMFNHVFVKNGSEIMTGYFREDSSTISSHMLSMANFLYPKGNVHIHDFYVPAAG